MEPSIHEPALMQTIKEHGFDKIAKVGTDRFSQLNENVYSQPINELIDKLTKLLITEVTINVRR